MKSAISLFEPPMLIVFPNFCTHTHNMMTIPLHLHFVVRVITIGLQNRPNYNYDKLLCTIKIKSLSHIGLWVDPCIFSIKDTPTGRTLN